MSQASLIYNLSDPLELESGSKLNHVDISYETYGTLNKTKSNAILICHALSADAHVAQHPENKTKGWWDDLVGNGKAIDTKKYFVICSNTIGSCRGSTGPMSINKSTKKPYGLKLPVITIGDMVSAQEALLNHLNIETLFAVVGGSMGGMQALEWSIRFPSKVKRCIAIATTAKLSPQSLAFGAVGRNAITSDPEWHKGDYYAKEAPQKGLAIARMIGHITYLSEQGMLDKFGRNLQEKTDFGYDFSSDFQIESYLKYQGDKFMTFFDANAYLYLSRAMSYFDLEKKYKSLNKAFKKSESKFLILSISSDWLYPSKQSKEIVKSLMTLSKDVTYAEIDSPFGHDGFLLECKKIGKVVKPFLGN
ncbi:homoserine O-acetyltransferase [Candidatus Marinamargulisbacteria bacterium SCGC AAA071-K20]|nr:homoserine O-acetyltransferase [Candidatus Marinamargulisbacteria bacterium SCGC AAA071-K20]